ncbi:hypothetical protein B1757_13740 [Acidithiobacillus marinus]|uniref:Uncharacterized protein n=1 Tax=Acidithiobacillus marinus TaxID=187490 RepID=A0A2I1DIG2_9PROT|nr:hypothetical protein [Acidithiobacillus marinus]PKY09660.1 hypothetical protein B1757_13740 [Acidithiobacillus marinus]
MSPEKKRGNIEKKTQIIEKIVDLLKKHGRCTISELSLYSDFTNMEISRSLYNNRKNANGLNIRSSGRGQAKQYFLSQEDNAPKTPAVYVRKLRNTEDFQIVIRVQAEDLPRVLAEINSMIKSCSTT